MMTTRQTALPGAAPKPHLTTVKPEGHKQWSADPERNEFWCLDCDARVTINKNDRSVEFGHTDDCPHKIDRSESPRVASDPYPVWERGSQ